uniref:CRM domain-containing protein n=1 Tax=Kalanchoe fedtschenkoi TaxID=63787 RepID=A0A7N0T893_KALFE
MAASSVTSSYHLLSNILRSPLPSAALLSLPLRRSLPVILTKRSHVTAFAPLRARARIASSRQWSGSVKRLSATPVRVSFESIDLQAAELEDDYDDEEEEEDFEDGEGAVVGEIKEAEDNEEEEEEVRVVKEAPKLDRSKLPELTIKEKKELASYAHSLGKKLKIQLVGKSGVTASLATSFVETLEANELLKIKIHATCPGEVAEIAKQLEDATGSVVVGQIGRTLILYRPSLSKMKAEERRRQERRVYVKKTSVFKPSFPGTQKKGPTSRPSDHTPSLRPNDRGSRGSSRVRTAE